MRAFTLLELLIVMAIIAVLVSILATAIARARRLAEATRCASQLRQVGQATKAYACDWRGYRPAGVFPDSFYRNSIVELTGKKPVRSVRVHSGLLVDRYLNNQLKVLYCEGAVFNSYERNYPLFYMASPPDVQIPYLQRLVGEGAARKEGKGKRQATMCDWYDWNSDPSLVPLNIRNHVDGINVLFSDGSVVWFRLPRKYWSNGSGMWSTYELGNLR